MFQESKESYGTIIINGEESLFYKITENNDNLINKLSVHIARDHNKGGQSSGRFMRIHEADVKEYVKQIVERTIKYFTNDGLPTIQELIIIGPAIQKKSMLRNELDSTCLNRIPINVLTSDGTIETSLLQVHNMIMKIDWQNENQIQEEFEELLRTNPDRLIFGDEIDIAIEEYRIKQLYIDSKQNNNYDIKVIIVNKQWINEYGGRVGITWY